MNRSVFLLVLLLVNYPVKAQSLFLLAGQSNAVGQGDSSLSQHLLPETAWEFKQESGSLVPLKDPFGENQSPFQQANTGSIAPAFAHRYHELTMNKVVMVAAARGGSSCHQLAELPGMGTWDTEGDLLLFDASVAKTKAAIVLTGIPFGGIIWIQGERDANAINKGELSSEAFQKELEALIQRFRKAFGKKMPFYLVLTGAYIDHPTAGFEQVRQVQKRIAEMDKWTHLVFTDTPDFPEKGWMKDQIHYNQTGLNTIGTAVAEAIFSLSK